MKRKFLNFYDCNILKEKRVEYSYVENDEFIGYISIVYVDKVNAPYIWGEIGESLCVADEGYIWLLYMPLESNHCITTVFNEKREIVNWYFDITYQNNVTEDGIPFYDDLYLDVVVLPSLETFLLDEDELVEALESKKISESQYNLAYREAKVLMQGLSQEKDTLVRLSYKYLDYMQSL